MNPLIYSGLTHRGCWYLNNRNRRLGTLEGRTRDLSDNPITRVNPASKCGVAAQTLNFRFFGVTLGYCISGSNLLSDYQYVQSQLCRDARGGYNRGFFIMDVYEVTNQQSFSDSLESIQNGNTSNITMTTQNSSARGLITPTSLLLTIALFIGSITFL